MDPYYRIGIRQLASIVVVVACVALLVAKYLVPLGSSTARGLVGVIASAVGALYVCVVGLAFWGAFVVLYAWIRRGHTPSRASHGFMVVLGLACGLELLSAVIVRLWAIGAREAWANWLAVSLHAVIAVLCLGIAIAPLGRDWRGPLLVAGLAYGWIAVVRVTGSRTGLFELGAEVPWGILTAAALWITLRAAKKRDLSDGITLICTIVFLGVVSVHWLASAGTAVSCQILNLRWEPEPNWAVVMPSAEQVRYFDGELGSQHVTYRIRETYPAQAMIDALVSKMTSRGWQYVAPGDEVSTGESTSSASWQYFVDGLSGEYVHEWTGYWRNNNGDVAVYMLTYRSSRDGPPTTDLLDVYSIWYPSVTGDMVLERILRDDP